MISIKPDEPEKPVKTADDPWIDELSVIDPPVSRVEPIDHVATRSDEAVEISTDDSVSESVTDFPNVPPAIADETNWSESPSVDFYPILDPAATDIPPPVHSGFENEGPIWPNERPYLDNAPPPLSFEPEPQYETIRRSGLAWSAGIVFFGTVAFTLLLGWIADLLIGSSPWGLVGGIVFGSIIAFIQFFRISSRMFPSHKHGPEVNPLGTRNEDEEDSL